MPTHFLLSWLFNNSAVVSDGNRKAVSPALCVGVCKRYLNNGKKREGQQHEDNYFFPQKGLLKQIIKQVAGKLACEMSLHEDRLSVFEEWSCASEQIDEKMYPFVFILLNNVERVGGTVA